MLKGENFLLLTRKHKKLWLGKPNYPTATHGWWVTTVWKQSTTVPGGLTVTKPNGWPAFRSRRTGPKWYCGLLEVCLRCREPIRKDSSMLRIRFQHYQYSSKSVTNHHTPLEWRHSALGLGRLCRSFELKGFGVSNAFLRKKTDRSTQNLRLFFPN